MPDNGLKYIRFVVNRLKRKDSDIAEQFMVGLDLDMLL